MATLSPDHTLQHPEVTSQTEADSSQEIECLTEGNWSPIIPLFAETTSYNDTESTESLIREVKDHMGLIGNGGSLTSSYHLSALSSLRPCMWLTDAAVNLLVRAEAICSPVTVVDSIEMAAWKLKVSLSAERPHITQRKADGTGYTLIPFHHNDHWSLITVIRLESQRPIISLYNSLSDKDMVYANVSFEDTKSYLDAIWNLGGASEDFVQHTVPVESYS